MVQADELDGTDQDSSKRVIKRVMKANPTVRGIQQLRKNSIQTIRDNADVLRHIIKNVSSRLVGIIHSPALVTKWELFFPSPKKDLEKERRWTGATEPARTRKTLRLYKLKSLSVLFGRCRS